MKNIHFEDMPLKFIHIRVALGGIGGQFCDGFILGVIGISLILAQKALNLSTWWLAAIGSASLIGLFIGSLISGIVADIIGRKLIFTWTMPIFFIISLLQFFVSQALELFILRLILGFALGADYVVGISLVSELSPKKFRAKLLSMMMVAWVGGYALAYFTGFIMQDFSEDAFRYILLSSAFPAFFVALLRLNIPSSILWLIQKGRIKEAENVVKKYFGANIILPRYENETKSAYFELFSKKQLANTAVGAVFYGAQVVPYFAISTFIPVVLQGLSVEDPYLGGIVYNAFLFIGSILGLLVINKITRRLFVVGSFYILALACGILALYTNMPSYLVISIISLFSCVLAGAGVLEFAYTPELFPTRLRASGIGFVLAFSRISGALGTFFLPILTEQYSVQAALWAVFVVCVFAGIFCHIFAPETSKQ